ncbi:bile acid:sodium symporter family protein [Ruegeria sp.]|uniref:bile acid:sodium symporter family protein n=1 Tax=Ruegeria sp. TaxID=1879320 RepID=UPI003B5C02AB
MSINEFMTTIAAPLILASVMFSLGLELKLADFTRLLRQPKAVLVGLGNQMLLLPVVAFALCYAFKLQPELAVGLMIIALCPGGSTTNVLSKLAGGNVALSVSLTALASLLAFLTVSLLASFSVVHFMGVDPGEIDTAKLTFSLFLMSFFPIVLGMGLTHFLPRAGTALARFMMPVSLLLLLLLVVGILSRNTHLLVEWGGILLAPICLMIAVMLALGLLSAKVTGLESRDATTISIESGIQNGTMAIAVAVILNAQVLGTPQGAETAFMMPAAIYTFVMYGMSIPFVMWRRKYHAAQRPGGLESQSA